MTASAFHPGMITSDISRDGGVSALLLSTRLAKAVLSTPDKAAEPLLYLATHPDARAINGQYFHKFKPEEPKNKQATDPDVAHRLWERSARLTGLPANDRT